MAASHYENPRIDRPDQSADAALGDVTLDWARLAWVSSMFLLGSVGSALTFSTSGLALFVGFTAFTLCLGHSLGMHRLFIHRSYRAPKLLEYFLVHLGVLVGLAGPFGMLRTHDLRDWAQRQPLCHSYFAHGERWYRDAAWQLVCRMRLARPPSIDIEAAYRSDPVYRFMEQTWMLQQLPWALAFYAIGGWSWVCWGIGSRVSVSILGHWLIGHIAHNDGGKDWTVDGAAVQGHNVPFVALLTMGENWHNNHHAFPGSAKLGLEPGQWDPGWWTLKLFEKAGLASDFVLPDDLSPRPELRRVTASATPGRHANVARVCES
ncbi:MAG: acyl-CoA desaturase [Pseudomonadota bacterium]